ncbi:ABC transporter permease [Streptomyces bambusae]|uniref:ABC transporter permease n=1 Tax=Streptomyces bambusae TaxID=1550616 RepID=A0ABS6ZBN5_9ACTN|nr:ABC transporter permease [Streptomyces bambusae]MBW5485182.1 ABC transporter permease [Streptomyces bambusae]
MNTLTLKPSRLFALGRSELTLLVRNRAALSLALLMPLAMVFGLKASLSQYDLEGGAAAVGEATLTGGIGMVLILVVYMNLVSAYVARREELVLKRLRTGEANDLEILAGSTLPSGVLALTQVAVLVAAGAATMDVRTPQNPVLLLAAVLAGFVLLAAMAAATSSFTRNVESAGLTTLPLFLASIVGSGMFVPIEMMPEAVASVCELLPLSGVMELVRAGWTGTGEAYDLMGAALTTLAWMVITVFAVQRWFRWEPRR